MVLLDSPGGRRFKTQIDKFHTFFVSDGSSLISVILSALHRQRPKLTNFDKFAQIFQEEIWLYSVA
jgi:hypothetical protein